MLYLTGATGHSGVWFLKKNKELKLFDTIKCIARNEEKFKEISNIDSNLIPCYGDLSNISFVEDSMKGASVVLHIASIYYSENIVKAAIKNNVKWCILVHTTGMYSKYKSASEEYIKIEEKINKYRDQIEITILRPTMIYGSEKDRNMIKLVDFLYRFKFFPLFGKGENLMQPVHARDLAEAYISVIKNKDKTIGEDYNLPGKKPIAYIDLIKTVSSTLGRKTIIIKIPLGLSIIAAKIYNAITRKAIISVEQVLRMQEDKAFDYKKAESHFGYNPIDFATGIKEEVEQYLTKKGIRK